MGAQFFGKQEYGGFNDISGLFEHPAKKLFISINGE